MGMTLMALSVASTMWEWHWGLEKAEVTHSLSRSEDPGMQPSSHREVASWMLSVIWAMFAVSCLLEVGLNFSFVLTAVSQRCKVQFGLGSGSLCFPSTNASHCPRHWEELAMCAGELRHLDTGSLTQLWNLSSLPVQLVSLMVLTGEKESWVGTCTTWTGKEQMQWTFI